jgi:hypothetical protein
MKSDAPVVSTNISIPVPRSTKHSSCRTQSPCYLANMKIEREIEGEGETTFAAMLSAWPPWLLT